MWTALVLVWISSLPLSGSRVMTPEPSYSVPEAVKSVTTKDMVTIINNMTTEKTAVAPAPVTLTRWTSTASLNSTVVTTEVTTQRTNISTPGMTTHSASPRTPVPPTSPGPTSTGQTPPRPTAVAPSLSTLHAHVPSTDASTSSRTAVVAVSPHAQTISETTTNMDSLSALSPAASTATNVSSLGPNPTMGPQTQPATIQATTGQPVQDTAGASTPSPPNSTSSVGTAGASTPSPPNTTSSVASVSLVVMTTTQTQTKEPTASAPAPPTSPAPEVESTAPTTQPSPTPPQGTVGPGTSQTPEQVDTKATPSTASTGPTSKGSGEPKVPVTDSCQLSTQGQYLVVTTEPLTPSLVNRTFLLAVLVLGVTLFITVLVVFALQAYESYKKRDYTQVDYLINGMYADSEM